MDLQSCPEDRCKFVQVIFFILGLVTLLPWNFFITATQYFESRLTPAVNSTEPAVGEWHFDHWMTLLSMLPLLLFTCLNSFLYPRIPERVRIAGSLFGIFLLFLVTVVMVMFPIRPSVFFGVTMTVIWFINSFGAVLQGSLFGLLGLLPAKYSSLFLSGQGVAGMFAAFASILAQMSDSDEVTAAFGYFITPCVVILIGSIFYFTLPQLEFAKYYLDKNRAKQRYEQEAKLELLKRSGEKIECVENRKTAFVSLEGSGNSDGQSEVAIGVIKVFTKIWKLAIAVCLIFTVTLSVFPAITSKVVSHTTEGKWKDYFTTVSCFLLFNIMDWFGRSVTACIMLPQKDSVILLCVVLRFCFLPLFMLCKLPDRIFLPNVFLHDGWFILFMLLFAFSNGYLVSLCMCHAPKKVSLRDAETAGAVMAFFLSLGLALGAALSFLVKFLI
uniref:equilibrative nucleoside transporter 2-like n=1 Tax=Pristiophorus japonicus TaxID=55135 RepID=UPI00398E3B5E